MKLILEEGRLEVFRDALWRTGNVLCDRTASIISGFAEHAQGPWEGIRFTKSPNDISTELVFYITSFKQPQGVGGSKTHYNRWGICSPDSQRDCPEPIWHLRLEGPGQQQILGGRSHCPSP